MFAIAMVLFLGTANNVYNDGARDIKGIEASVIKQVTHPTISKADYSKLNQ